MSSLDPEDWDAARASAHRMLDDAFDALEHLKDLPAWQPMPAGIRDELQAPAPAQGKDLDAVFADYQRLIAPYGSGNRHPGFMGWAQGGGTIAGMMAELLAASLNINCGGRDHAGTAVEAQVVRWAADIFDFPANAGGVLVTGSSIANFVGVLAARRAILGPESRRGGIAAARLTGYASAAAHACLAKGFDMAGLGSTALRLIPTDQAGRMDMRALAAAIARDRAAEHVPFLIVGTAGTVDIGAVDDLSALARLAKREGLWLHVDAAFGGLAALVPSLRPQLAGIERADSIALDFHKWGQVQYDAGLILARDAARLEATFSNPAPYLERDPRGLAAGDVWPCDLGPDLSRGFRALKIWFTIQTYGLAALGEVIAGTCALAARLADRVDAEPKLERLAPVGLNIVCFRYNPPGNGLAGPALDRLNRDIVAELQRAGKLVPSTTWITGTLAIRAAILNHRTTEAETDLLVEEVCRQGDRLSRE